MVEKIGLEAIFDVKDFQKGLAAYMGGMSRAEGATEKMAGTAGLFGLGVASGIGAAFGSAVIGTIESFLDKIGEAIGAIQEFGEEAIMAAARVREMDIVLGLVGERAGYADAELQGVVQQMKELGIRTDVAQATVAQLVTRGIDLSKGLDLAAAARDLAVFAEGGADTSETLEGLLHGILMFNARVLRTHGALVQVGKVQEEFAHQTDRTAQDLSNEEKILAVLNAVLADAETKQGAYNAAMETGSKQLRSFDRYIYELQKSLGEPFQQAFDDVVFAGKDFLEVLQQSVSVGGWLRPVLDGIAAGVTQLTSRLREAASLFGRVMADLNLIFGDPMLASLEGTRAGIERLQAELASVMATGPAFDSTIWQSQADEIEKVQADLGKAIADIWEETNFQIAQTQEDYDRKRARDLADHMADVAEIYTDLAEKVDDLMAKAEDKRKDILEKVQDEQRRAAEGHEDEMTRLRRDAALAETKEEHDLIQELMREQEGKYAEELALIEENKRKEMAEAEAALQEEIRKERDRAEKIAAEREKAFRLSRAREEEDMAIRLARMDEQARRQEDRLKEAADERVAILQQEIANAQAAQQAAYDNQINALRANIFEQSKLLAKQTADWFTEYAKRPEAVAAAEEEVKTVFDKLYLDYEELKKNIEAQDWGRVLVQILWSMTLNWGRIVDTFYRMMGDFFVDLSIALAIGMASFAQDVDEKLDEAWTEVRTGIATWLRDTADEWATKLEEGLDRLATGIGEWADRTIRHITSRAWDIGVAIISGIIRGVWHRAQDLWDDLTRITEHALSLARWILGIGSPSRAFFEVGRQMMAGWVAGVEALSPELMVRVGAAAGGTMQAATSTSTSNYYFNQTVNTMAPVSTVASDFRLMRAMIGG